VELVERCAAERPGDTRATLGTRDALSNARKRACMRVGGRDGQHERPGRKRRTPLIRAIQLDVSADLVSERAVPLGRAVGLDEGARQPATPLKGDERVGDRGRRADACDGLPVALPQQRDVARRKGGIAEGDRDLRERGGVIEQDDARRWPDAPTRICGIARRVEPVAGFGEGVSARGPRRPARKSDFLDESSLAKLPERAMGYDAPRTRRKGGITQKERLKLISTQRPEACQQSQSAFDAEGRNARRSVQVERSLLRTVAAASLRYTEQGFRNSGRRRSGRLHDELR